jgi:hypothetical protein
MYRDCSSFVTAACKEPLDGWTNLLIASAFEITFVLGL